MRVESDLKFIVSFRLMKEQTFHEYLGWKFMLVSRKKTKLERYAKRLNSDNSRTIGFVKICYVFGYG